MWLADRMPSADPNTPGAGWQIGDYYSGGGSGHVTAGAVITPLAGIRHRASLGPDSVQVASLSGGSSDKADAANLALAREADVSIVVCATTCGESEDRKSLSLDGGCDALVSAVGRVAKKTIVLVQAPGAFLTPWRGEVEAIAVMFLGGQETGGAWADVLFGDTPPSGRLPIELPSSEAETILPNPQSSVPYTEGLATSYRNTQHRPAFCFGHGLSTTTFEFGALTPGPTTLCPAKGSAAVEVCLGMTVTNTGTRVRHNTSR